MSPGGADIRGRPLPCKREVGSTLRSVRPGLCHVWKPRSRPRYFARLPTIFATGRVPLWAPLQPQFLDNSRGQVEMGARLPGFQLAPPAPCLGDGEGLEVVEGET
jgi:hypothetical protein